VVLKYGKDDGAEGVRTPDLLNAIQEKGLNCMALDSIVETGGGWFHMLFLVANQQKPPFS